MSAPARVATGSADLLAAVLDAGSFRTWDAPAAAPDGAPAGYRRELAAAAATAGTDEALVTGEGRIGGRRIAVAVSEFAFLGGSVGTTAARRLVAAVEHATACGLPLLLSPASGGTRMQEGTPAFLEMITIADRVAAHRRAGHPVAVHLRHPTTGGALASWGSLGSVTTAEPGALVGFLGPKVYRSLYGHRFPDGVQTAENLHARGVVDVVVGPAELAGLLARLLAVTARGPSRAAAAPVPEEAVRPPVAPDAWSSVLATRRPDRPGVRDLLRIAARDVVELSGTGTGEVAAATVLALARIDGAACVLVGQDRAAGRAPGPSDLRVARRGFALAGELGLPLVTLIDTAGGELSAEAEEGALAGEIARCLADLTALEVPSVSVLAGQGAGGVALALFGARRRIAARNAWLTPLPPEGASAIVHGTPDRAAEVVAGQCVRSTDLVAAGAVHRIVEELPDAADEPETYLARLARGIVSELGIAAGPPSGRSPR
ncbi:carboxyl transferase domain-containing protein [Pseudonocardia alni]|uniref:carboxyl transferase domain-containing protein n=1 Tax=Pseudonocardia alni TaxID=33907 RepID=UPI0033328174